MPVYEAVIYLPQLVLGVALSWALLWRLWHKNQTPNVLCWSLYVANLIWTVAYDTSVMRMANEDNLKLAQNQQPFA
ncbi:MAG: hypothetical protein IPM78_11880 [Moraxellaceae bacterium]|nr:hypothetical protein [Moraxellaceae bacterium]